MMPDPIERLNAALAGRYRVERTLGEGGMALVYLADDLRHERRVALKVLKPELAAAVGAGRFLIDLGNPWRVLRAYHQAGAGDIAGAAQTVEELQAHSPQHLLTSLGVFLKHAWRGEKAEALASVSLDLETAAWWDDLWPLSLAAGYAMIGELDRAFPWLDHAVEQGIMNVVYLREHDPFLANLRGDPRFQGILEKAARMAAEVEMAAAAAAELT